MSVTRTCYNNKQTTLHTLQKNARRFYKLLFITNYYNKEHRITVLILCHRYVLSKADQRSKLTVNIFKSQGNNN